jgi:hypothetical protein
MTKQIDELMAMIWAFALTVERNGRMDVDAEEDSLRSALEAALKPGGVKLTHEQWLAVREGHLNVASSEYFDARPQLDSAGNRRIFYAGHCKGYEAAYPAQTPIRDLLIQAASMAVVLERRGEYQSATRVADAVLESDAPRAQTPAPPPRLTDDEINDIYNNLAKHEPYSVVTILLSVARATETAVRRQFLGVNDE